MQEKEVTEAAEFTTQKEFTVQKELIAKSKVISDRRMTTQKLVAVALLVAVNVVLSRFLSISTQEIKIGFAFIPVMIGSLALGPVGGGIVGALGDLVGAVFFPIGAYFPGFTVCAFLTGWNYGIFLKNNQIHVRIILAVSISEIVCSLLLNSWWISLLYGIPYWGSVLTRILQSIVMIIVECVVLKVLVKYLNIIKEKASIGV